MASSRTSGKFGRRLNNQCMLRASFAQISFLIETRRDGRQGGHPRILDLPMQGSSVAKYDQICAGESALRFRPVHNTSPAYEMVPHNQKKYLDLLGWDAWYTETE